MQNSTTTCVLTQALQGFNGATFASVDTITNVRLTGGKSNPYQGRVTKFTRANIALFSTGAGYQNRVNKLLGLEGEGRTFEAGNLPWGERLGNSPVIENKNKRYMQAIHLQKPSLSFYLVDGSTATTEQIAEFKATLPAKREGAQGGLTNKVIVRTYAFDSIRRIKIGGVEYRFDQNNDADNFNENEAEA